MPLDYIWERTDLGKIGWESFTHSACENWPKESWVGSRENPFCLRGERGRGARDAFHIREEERYVDEHGRDFDPKVSPPSWWLGNPTRFCLISRNRINLCHRVFDPEGVISSSVRVFLSFQKEISGECTFRSRNLSSSVRGSLTEKESVGGFGIWSWSGGCRPLQINALSKRFYLLQPLSLSLSQSIVSVVDELFFCVRNYIQFRSPSLFPKLSFLLLMNYFSVYEIIFSFVTLYIYIILHAGVSKISLNRVDENSFLDNSAINKYSSISFENFSYTILHSVNHR